MTLVSNITDPKQIARCFDALLNLRPMLKSNEAFVEQVQFQQKHQGYILSAIFVDSSDSSAAACIGFRPFTTLYFGHMLFVDDLITAPLHRHKGYGKRLLDYAREYAIEQGMSAVTLESGYDRRDAHRLYLNCGYQMWAHAFRLVLPLASPDRSRDFSSEPIETQRTDVVTVTGLRE